jgi:hypothetical protein
MKIVSVCLDLITPQWQVELNYALDKITEEQPASRRKWLELSGIECKCLYIETN